MTQFGSVGSSPFTRLAYNTSIEALVSVGSVHDLGSPNWWHLESGVGWDMMILIARSDKVSLTCEP